MASISYPLSINPFKWRPRSWTILNYVSLAVGDNFNLPFSN